MSRLNDYFLQIMGITTWHRKNESPCEYLLLLTPQESKPNAKLKALIERLIDAVDWPHDTTQKIGFDHEFNAEKIKAKVQALQPKKIIMFGIDFAKHLDLPPKEQTYMIEGTIPCAIVSSLNSLLEDKAAKRRTWDLLQKFENNLA